MHGGFLLDPLPLVTAMVHPVGDVRQFQRPILHLGPSFPPPLDLAALLLVQLARLFPQPLRAKAARRRQQVGMVIALVALATRCMDRHVHRSEEHTSELQSLMRISYAVFSLKKKKRQ